jgi:hypothetical protein
MMNRFLFMLLLFLQPICLGLLWISCFPGLIFDVLFNLFLIVYIYGIPLLILLMVIFPVGMKIIRKMDFLPVKQARSDRQKILIIIAITVGLTAILWKTNLPQITAFAISSSAFDAVVVDADKLQSICNSQPVNQQLGLYNVIECDRDSRGGIYFSTGRFSTMDSADFYGFVYKPNPYGNYHFGSDIYEYYPIKGDWYGFMAGKRS